MLNKNNLKFQLTKLKNPNRRFVRPIDKKIQKKFENVWLRFV